MNSPQYRNAYMANLKLEISNNAKNLRANLDTPALTQLQNPGKPSPKPVQKKK
jgi:hypothetical protein